MATYVSSITKELALILSLKYTLEVEPDADVSEVLSMVEVAVVESAYQHEAAPLVSAEPVLQVFEPLSRNF